MEGVEGEVDMIAVVGGKEEAMGILRWHVEFGARRLADDTDDGVVTCCTKFKGTASGEVESKVVEFAKLGRKGL